jgi:CubicO group peptidase (beta-lactamase class C family)
VASKTGRLGELVSQVSGAGVCDFLISEFLGPLGLRDIHLGLPNGLWPRQVPIRGRGPAARQPGSPQTFGHDGSNCGIAWADPGRRLVFVYLTDRLTAGHEGARNQGEFADAIIAACA